MAGGFVCEFRRDNRGLIVSGEKIQDRIQSHHNFG